MNIIHSAAGHRSQSMASKKLVYSAADRNKDPILSILRRYVHRGMNQTFLEISSGSGQHVAHFARHFPHVTFYPSECDPKLLESIAAYASDFPNVKEPLMIDVRTDCQKWGGGIFAERSIGYIFNANMMHISPYECSVGLFRNAGKLLNDSGILFTYGPYAVDGKITPESNVNFDKSLRSQNPSWGLRDIRDLENLAKENNMKISDIFDMPANNKTIVWKKDYVQHNESKNSI